MTACVRDEQDVIGTWLDYHHARGVSHFVVRDTGSQDLTLPVLREYASAGLVSLTEAPRPDFDQSAWVTEMAEEARACHHADWVLHGDADEFWWPAAPDLPAAFAQVPPDVNAVAVPRSNFLLAAGETGRWWERSIARDLRRLNYEGRRLHPKHAHRAVDKVVVDHGAMGLSGAGCDQPWEHPGLEILHVPARSRAQLVRKATRGALALARTADLPPGVGSTWTSMAADASNGRLHAWLDRQCLEAAGAAGSARDGTVVRDERLSRYLASLHSAGQLGRGDPAVIIPVLGRHHLTQAVIADLRRDGHPCTVYIVDNGGDYEPFGDERVLQPPANLHWAGGCNLGLLTAQDQVHPLYVLLNNDVRLSPGFLAGLAAATQASAAGLLAPAYDRNWPQQRVDYNGPADGYIPAEREHPVPFTDGTCLAIPHQTLRLVGLLDERTWPRYGWGADKDYALRVRLAGGHVQVTERAYLNHLGRQTAAAIPWYDEAEAEAENNAGMTSKWGAGWRDLLYAGFDSIPRAGLVQERLARTAS